MISSFIRKILEPDLLNGGWDNRESFYQHFMKQFVCSFPKHSESDLSTMRSHKALAIMKKKQTIRILTYPARQEGLRTLEACWNGASQALDAMAVILTFDDDELLLETPETEENEESFLGLSKKQRRKKQRAESWICATPDDMPYFLWERSSDDFVKFKTNLIEYFRARNHDLIFVPIGNSDDMLKYHESTWSDHHQDRERIYTDLNTKAFTSGRLPKLEGYYLWQDMSAVKGFEFGNATIWKCVSRRKDPNIVYFLKAH